MMFENIRKLGIKEYISTKGIITISPVQANWEPWPEAVDVDATEEAGRRLLRLVFLPIFT